MAETDKPHGLLYAVALTWYLVIKATCLSRAFSKGDQHRPAAYFAIIVDLTGTFLGRRNGYFKALKARRAGDKSCFHAVNLLPRDMIVNQLSKQKPFTTADGSTIRSILDATNAPVQNQSLAEASLPEGAATQRHYHQLSEEIYFILEGHGTMEIDGEQREVGPGDAILIPATAWHQIEALSTMRFLCCCSPVYAHEDTYFE